MDKISKILEIEDIIEVVDYFCKTDPRYAKKFIELAKLLEEKKQ
jgi:hypothetical protein